MSVGCNCRIAGRYQAGLQASNDGIRLLGSLVLPWWQLKEPNVLYTEAFSRAPALQTLYATTSKAFCPIVANAVWTVVCEGSSGYIRYNTCADLCRFIGSRFPLQKWVSCLVDPLGSQNESLDSSIDSTDVHVDCGGAPRIQLTQQPTVRLPTLVHCDAPGTKLSAANHTLLVPRPSPP